MAKLHTCGHTSYLGELTAVNVTPLGVDTWKLVTGLS